LARWGLYYKGAEPVSPAEWNAIVDALNELDKRTPIEFNCGKAEFTGDGTTTTFEITHGLTTAPTLALVGKAAPDLPYIDYWDADATHIRVTFERAPAPGVAIRIWWLAIRK